MANALSFSITLPNKGVRDVPLGIQSPKMFKEVGAYLLTLMITEINEGVNPSFTVWKGRGKAFIAAYQTQFTAYAQGAYPFNTPLGDGENPLDWWRALHGSANGGILSVGTSVAC